MVIQLSYIAACIFFILSIRGLASPNTARRGNIFGIIGMGIAVIATGFLPGVHNILYVAGAVLAGGIVGAYFALRVKMTSLPQMVAAFNGLGGLAAVFISIAEILAGSTACLETSLSVLIGALAFSGSMVAFAKLQGLMPARALTFPLQQILNLVLILIILRTGYLFCVQPSIDLFYILTGLAILLGILIVLPIGGADMPVVISVLNAYSGWAGVAVGFAMKNELLIITGAMVGASGSILSYIMCKSMNRSLANVMLGGFGSKKTENTKDTADKTAKTGSPDDASFIMQNAGKVIVIPGYGMAVAQAQHTLFNMYSKLKAFGVDIKFAIHPVAGRMPGHMNVLLAEANIPYEDVIELDESNHELQTADVAFVIGANDITNPSAKTDKSSPIYGMPVLDVGLAKTVFFVKRSLASGYSGVDNPLFYADNTAMLYGDAKKVTEQIVKALEGA